MVKRQEIFLIFLFFVVPTEVMKQRRFCRNERVRGRCGASATNQAISLQKQQQAPRTLSYANSSANRRHSWGKPWNKEPLKRGENGSNGWHKLPWGPARLYSSVPQWLRIHCAWNDYINIQQWEVFLFSGEVCLLNHSVVIAMKQRLNFERVQIDQLTSIIWKATNGTEVMPRTRNKLAPKKGHGPKRR